MRCVNRDERSGRPKNGAWYDSPGLIGLAAVETCEEILLPCEWPIPLLNGDLGAVNGSGRVITHKMCG